MKCKDCINFQRIEGTAQIETKTLFGRKYTQEEIIILSEKAEPLYDCPYAEDWCEGEFEANILCENMFKKK